VCGSNFSKGFVPFFLFALLCWLPVGAQEAPTAAQTEEMQALLDQSNDALAAAKALEKTIDSMAEGTKARQKLIGTWFDLHKVAAHYGNRLIKKVDEYYKIPLPEGVPEPEYDPVNITWFGSTKKEKVLLGQAAFKNLPVLVSTKIHEVTHAQQWVEGRWPRQGDEKGKAMVEIEAYSKEEAALPVTGLSGKDRRQIELGLKFYKGQLSKSNLARVESKKFDAEAIHLKDALEQGHVKAEFKGQGRAAGKVFKLKLTPNKRKNLKVEIVSGTVLSPNSEGVQTMMVCETVSVDVKDEPVECDLQGYCLDPEKSPPPKSEEQPEELDWTVQSPGEGPEPQRFQNAKSVIEAGQSLSDSGKFSDIMGPRHEETVIQRALWYQANPEWNKERLKKDLVEQLAENGKQLPEEKVEELTDNIWKDVDLTLKTVRGSGGTKVD
jgi:hypothetical protein